MFQGVSASGDSRASATLCAVLLAWLCLVLLVPIKALAGEPVTIVEGTANVLHITGPQWPTTRLRVTDAAAGTVLRVSDCSSFSQYTRELTSAGATVEDDFPSMLCDRGHQLADGTLIGVAKLPITSGAATFNSDATFRDARGVMNLVEIPSLPAALVAEDGSGTYAEYALTGIENESAGRSTYIAFMTDGGGTAQLELAVFDNEGRQITIERAGVDGFAWYTLRTPLRIGSVTIRRRSGHAAGVWAVGFVGFAEGGSPRTIVPTLAIRTAQ